MQGAPVVFLMHGLLCSADTWIAHYPEYAPAFVLAREGYDVWLGNVRGSTHSRKHKVLDPDFDNRYWNYSLEEISRYDLPASIDLALLVSGVDNLTYIGHSQGATIMLVGLVEREEWFLERVNFFIALGPIARMENTR
mmetsp:Transcript_36079/g.55400  ORF Transcript_36079/g.55400 Transcript_36079/m.55400 type:complete len:138 (+) Transcript_36079:577-990(+)